MSNNKSLTLHHDPLGLAYKSFYKGNKKAEFTLHSPQFDPDDISVDYFFRTYDEMPLLEQTALLRCTGKILDVGAGSGTHSLILQNKGFDVTALDISQLACEVMNLRGINNIVCENFWNFSAERFDTILFLMNGIGLIESIQNLPSFFKHVSNILSPSGKLLVDSSDLRYLFEEDDGSFLIPLQENYYGQVEFSVQFEDYISEPFSWIYLDFDSLEHAAKQAGFKCTCVEQGSHYDFLAEITRL